MSKFDDCMADFRKQLSSIGVKHDDDLLAKVAKGCGPSIYNRDSATVASSDQAELDRVKNNFLVKKLGCKDGPALDKAIADVVAQLGSGTKNKYRAVFYYLLVKNLKKESAYK